MDEMNITELEQSCKLLLISHEPISHQSDCLKSLTLFLDNPSNFRNFYSLLVSSRHHCFVYLLSLSISKNISEEWIKLSFEEKHYLYNTFISMIFNNDKKPGYLISGLCKTLARICRLGWIELDEINKNIPLIIETITKDTSLDEIGLKFFEELLIEMTEPTALKAINKKRKVVLNFRDEGLGSILSYCVFTLLNHKTLSSSAIKSLLNLINHSLGFDFLYVFSDEYNEDIFNLQIPLAWKTYFENNSLLEKIKTIILNNNGEIEFLGIRVLSQMGAIRKSIFSSSDEIKNYIKPL